MLPLNLGKIGLVAIVHLFKINRFQPCYRSLSDKVRNKLKRMLDGIDINSVNNAAFCSVCSGNIEAFNAVFPCAYRHRQHTLDGSQCAVERKLTDKCTAVKVGFKCAERL